MLSLRHSIEDPSIRPTFAQYYDQTRFQHPRYQGVIADYLCLEGGGTDVWNWSAPNSSLDGTLTGAAWSKGGITFAGVAADHVATNIVTDFNGGPVTMMMWYRCPTDSGLLEGFWGGVGNRQFRSNNGILEFYEGSTMHAASASSGLDVGTHFVAASVDFSGTSNGSALYADGALVKTFTATSSNTQLWRWWGRAYTFSTTMNGTVFRAIQLDRLVSPSEIREWHDAPYLEFSTRRVRSTVAAADTALTVAEQESVTVADTPTMSLFQGILLPSPTAEAVTVTDTPTLRLDQLFITAVDPVSVGEEVSAFPDQLFIDQEQEVTVTDTPTGLLPQLFITASDPVDVTDVTPTLLIDTLFIDEVEAITVGEVADAETAGSGQARSVTEEEAITVDEVVSLLLSFLWIDVTETVTVTDTPTTGLVEALNIDEVEAITVNEVTDQYPAPLSVTEQEDIIVGEDIEAFVDHLQHLANESVTVTDTPTLLLPFLCIDEVESVTVTDTSLVGLTAAGFINIPPQTEAVTVGESVRVQIGGGNRVNDDIAAIRQRFRIVGERRHQDRRSLKP